MSDGQPTADQMAEAELADRVSAMKREQAEAGGRDPEASGDTQICMDGTEDEDPKPNGLDALDSVTAALPGVQDLFLADVVDLLIVRVASDYLRSEKRAAAIVALSDAAEALALLVDSQD